jgi:hypothetical protein
MAHERRQVVQSTKNANWFVTSTASANATQSAVTVAT